MMVLTSIWLCFRKTDSSGKEKLSSIVFQDGDLVFRRGRSVESFAIYLADRDHDFSHIGMVVMDHAKPFVIHAIPGEPGERTSMVVNEPVQSFLNEKKASHWAVYRSRFPEKKAHLAASKAKDFYNRRLVFDDNYDLKTDSRLYCSELVLKAYQTIGLDLGHYPERELKFVMGSKKILFPSAFIQSPDFFKICSY